VTAHATRVLGLVVLGLGGGRHAEGEAVDHAVGLSRIAAPGEAVGPGERPLCLLHARDEASADVAEQTLLEAISVGDARTAVAPVIAERIT
jgi:thymidine phosphorylase